MNASDSVPATINTIPMLRANPGRLASSSRSRIEAISTSASVSPSPAPIAKSGRPRAVVQALGPATFTPVTVPDRELRRYPMDRG